MNARIILPILMLAAAAPALGQSNIAQANKFAWQENCGWTNWRDANAAAQGVRVHGTFLSGFAWGESIGFVNFGDGTPGGGSAYTNASGADHGVNILGGGDLSGYGWSENAGWINTAPFVPAAQRARFDALAKRFRGYAWGENIGWLNLDDAAHFVGLACYPDCNPDGLLTVADFGCFQTKFVSGDPYADCTNDGNLTVADFGCFQTKFVAGCP
jgi:hypothetical protein